MKNQTDTNTMNVLRALNQRGRFGAVAAVKMTASVAALFAVLSHASASTFSFSTGNPDGKIATLSRPASPGIMQTETADDFVVTQAVVITEATFTGLLPLGTALSGVGEVEVEIYHVFPGDSALPPSGNVPT